MFFADVSVFHFCFTIMKKVMEETGITWRRVRRTELSAKTLRRRGWLQKTVLSAKTLRWEVRVRNKELPAKTLRSEGRVWKPELSAKMLHREGRVRKTEQNFWVFICIHKHVFCWCFCVPLLFYNNEKSYGRDRDYLCLPQHLHQWGPSCICAGPGSMAMTTVLAHVD